MQLQNTLSSTQSLTPLSEEIISQEDVKRVGAALKEICFSVSRDCLSEYVCTFHDNSAESIQQCLNRVNILFTRLFPTSTLLNPTIYSYQLLNFEDIEQAMEKANTLYKAYRDQCIEEAVSRMPNYLCKNHKFDKKDLPILRIIFMSALEVLKKEAFESQFKMLHESGALRIIHYALGIPPSDPRSEISFVLCFKYYEQNINLVKRGT